MTPQEWAAKISSDAQARTEALSAAADTAASEAAVKIGFLASRAGNGTVLVRRDGPTVTLSLTTTSRGLAHEVRRWAREPERAKELAEEARGVRA